jgi:hypothetical protein
MMSHTADVADPLQLKANWQTSHDVCIRLMWLDATSAYPRFSLSAVVPADMIQAPFVVGAREDRIYVLDLMRA